MFDAILRKFLGVATVDEDEGFSSSDLRPIIPKIRKFFELNAAEKSGIGQVDELFSHHPKRDELIEGLCNTRYDLKEYVSKGEYSRELKELYKSVEIDISSLHNLGDLLSELNHDEDKKVDDLSVNMDAIDNGTLTWDSFKVQYAPLEKKQEEMMTLRRSVRLQKRIESKMKTLQTKKGMTSKIHGQRHSTEVEDFAANGAGMRGIKRKSNERLGSNNIKAFNEQENAGEVDDTSSESEVDEDEEDEQFGFAKNSAEFQTIYKCYHALTCKDLREILKEKGINPPRFKAEMAEKLAEIEYRAKFKDMDNKNNSNDMSQEKIIEDCSKMTVAELKEDLKELGQPIYGRKQELIERLAATLEELENSEEIDEETLNSIEREADNLENNLKISALPKSDDVISNVLESSRQESNLEALHTKIEEDMNATEQLPPTDHIKLEEKFPVMSRKVSLPDDDEPSLKKSFPGGVNISKVSLATEPVQNEIENDSPKNTSTDNNKFASHKVDGFQERETMASPARQPVVASATPEPVSIPAAHPTRHEVLQKELEDRMQRNSSTRKLMTSKPIQLGAPEESSVNPEPMSDDEEVDEDSFSPSLKHHKDSIAVAKSSGKSKTTKIAGFIHETPDQNQNAEVPKPAALRPPLIPETPLPAILRLRNQPPKPIGSGLKISRTTPAEVAIPDKVIDRTMGADDLSKLADDLESFVNPISALKQVSEYIEDKRISERNSAEQPIITKTNEISALQTTAQDQVTKGHLKNLVLGNLVRGDDNATFIPIKVDQEEEKPKAKPKVAALEKARQEKERLERQQKEREMRKKKHLERLAQKKEQMADDATSTSGISINTSMTLDKLKEADGTSTLTSHSTAKSASTVESMNPRKDKENDISKTNLKPSTIEEEPLEKKNDEEQDIEYAITTDCDSDDSEDDENYVAKKPAKWAEKANVNKLWLDQAHSSLDPDEIYGSIIEPPDLVTMFRVTDMTRVKRLNVRGSSAKWAHDGVTLQEHRQYKLDLKRSKLPMASKLFHKS